MNGHPSDSSTKKSGELSKLDQAISDMRDGQSSYAEEDWRSRLSNFLASQNVQGEITQIKRPNAGASAASIIFTLQNKNEQAKRYVARLQPDSSFWTHFDTVEQFNVQRALHKARLPVPNALWLDEQGRYLGKPGYVMAFASGEPSTPAYFSDGPMANVDTEKRFRMLRNMISALAQLHQKADASAISGLESKGRGEGTNEREMNLWFDLIGSAKPYLTDVYAPVRQWLVDIAPKVPQPVLLHGDFQGSNVLWQNEQVSAILDFEIVRTGAPECDLAYQCIMDEIGARFYGGLDIELPSLQQRARWYEDSSGIKLQHLDYYYTKAVFQLACGMVRLTRDMQTDLRKEPTPIMDYMNRRLIALLPEDLKQTVNLPVLQ